jgi:hypothetical protein
VTSPPPARRDDPRATSPWPFVGMVAIATAFFLYAATPTVLDTPWWAVVLLMLGWVVAFVLACAWFTRRPVATAVLGLAVLLAWFPIVLAAARFLDWA